MDSVILETAILHSPFMEDRKENPGIITALLGVDTLVYSDDSRLGAWPMKRHAFSHISPDATHLLLMEDDVIPCKNAYRAAREIARCLPDEIVTLFGGAPGAKGYRAGFNLFRPPKAVSAVTGQALLISKKDAEGIVKFADGSNPPIVGHGGDERIYRYLVEKKRQMVLTGPSLFEHIGVKSAMGNRFTGHNWVKMAGVFPGVEFDAMSINWAAAAQKLRQKDGHT